MSALSERQIYLASRSPRRRELLRQAGATVDVLLLREDPKRGTDVDETPLANEAPDVYVARVARTKAQAGWSSLGRRNLVARPVLAADTTVTLANEIFGKPKTPLHAEQILAKLSGRTHTVYTAVAVAYMDRCEFVLSKSTVEFRELDVNEIRRYVMTHEPLDKAGAYAVQGRAALFIKNIVGSYSGIMGLPLFETTELLKRFDIALL